MYTEVFPLKLKQARKEYGYTQEEIAKLLNITQPCYAGYETGRRQPNLETFGYICDLLGVSADWLLGTKGGK